MRGIPARSMFDDDSCLIARIRLLLWVNYVATTHQKRPKDEACGPNDCLISTIRHCLNLLRGGSHLPCAPSHELSNTGGTGTSGDRPNLERSLEGGRGLPQTFIEVAERIPPQGC